MHWITLIGGLQKYIQTGVKQFLGYIFSAHIEKEPLPTANSLEYFCSNKNKKEEKTQTLLTAYLQ